MRGKWIGLKLPHFIGIWGNFEKEIRDVRMQTKFLKLNFDRASRGNSNREGIGCSIHKSEDMEI